MPVGRTGKDPNAGTGNREKEERPSHPVYAAPVSHLPNQFAINQIKVLFISAAKLLTCGVNCW